MIIYTTVSIFLLFGLSSPKVVNSSSYLAGTAASPEVLLLPRPVAECIQLQEPAGLLILKITLVLSRHGYTGQIVIHSLRTKHPNHGELWQSTSLQLDLISKSCKNKDAHCVRPIPDMPLLSSDWRPK
jgi:hypothetical protein